MSKSMYFRPNVKELTFSNYVDNFVKNFGLDKLDQIDSSYFLENDNMLVKIYPDMAEVLVYDSRDNQTIFNLKKYFFS